MTRMILAFLAGYWVSKYDLFARAYAYLRSKL